MTSITPIEQLFYELDYITNRRAYTATFKCKYETKNRPIFFGMSSICINHSPDEIS